MIRSMTGYGRGEATDTKRVVKVDIKAVNHRYSDINIRLPRKYAFSEDSLRREIKKRLFRGKIDVAVTVEPIAIQESSISFDSDLARQYHGILQELSKIIGNDDNSQMLSIIAKMPDVIRSEEEIEDEQEMIETIMSATSMALDDICYMRQMEGEKLAQDIVMRLSLIENICEKIKERAPEVGNQYAEKLKVRMSEILEGAVEVPTDRILIEAAIFADKANITEELVRLDSHIKQMRLFISDETDSIGKKIDFLVQEMNREANTIGSKSNDIEITSLMIDLKAEIEKIREQVQNIE